MHTVSHRSFGCNVRSLSTASDSETKRTNSNKKNDLFGNDGRRAAATITVIHCFVAMVGALFALFTFCFGHLLSAQKYFPPFRSLCYQFYDFHRRTRTKKKLSLSARARTRVRKTDGIDSVPQNKVQITPFPCCAHNFTTKSNKLADDTGKWCVELNSVSIK